MGTSARPVRLMFPVRANTLEPLLLSVPIPENHPAPLRIIPEMLAYVSTLLILVGLPHSPDAAG